MSENNELNKLKNKTVSGAKWLIIVSVVSIPLSFLTNIVIGRISAQALGIYSTILIFLQTIATFVVFGGPTVLSNYIPKSKNKNDISNFIWSYFIIIMVLFLIFTISTIFLPALKEKLFGNISGMELYLSLYIIAPLYVLGLFFQYVLIGFIDTGISTFLSKLHIFLIPVLLGISYITFQENIESNLRIIILVAILITNIVGNIIGYKVIRKKRLQSEKFKFHLPKGFWKFSIFVHLSTIFTFAYNNLDKIYVLSLGDLGQLGIYQAIITIYTFSKYIPQLLFNVTVPLFSNLINDGKYEIVKSTYYKLEKYIILMIIILNLFIIAYSKYLLLFFGKQYATFNKVLILFAMSNAITILSYVNTPLLVVLEKNKERFMNSFCQIFIQLSLTIILIQPYGIYGISLAKIFGVIIAQIYPSFIIMKKCDLGIKIPKQFFLGAIVMLLYGGLNLLNDLNIFINTLYLSISIIIFLTLSKYKLKDFKELYKMARR
ncbi:lipopolysaccharide biosynthesis protein [Crassaminicella profunda]|uniref:lipopolysaccharide biosynthesis protein n=1 Tax=Crassaminicella profunda TaxID=1286698 RepID=UPI001CA73BC0|nr:oligosaccharide flippase family protein [Crassaminicella profunda]QZY55549.1 oligosaccharide flippase family protein [Crassaminicella profunda]